MGLTKFGHACVRLEKDDSVLVIDPGSFSEESALDGAQAVLITHEHFDHVDADRLRRAAEANPSLEIWTNEGVAAALTGVPAKIQVVRHGDAFDTARFGVKVVGEWHAPNHPDLPIVRNVGFLVDEEVFYPVTRHPPGVGAHPPGADQHAVDEGVGDGRVSPPGPSRPRLLHPRRPAQRHRAQPDRHVAGADRTSRRPTCAASNPASRSPCRRTGPRPGGDPASRPRDGARPTGTRPSEGTPAPWLNTLGERARRVRNNLGRTTSGGRPRETISGERPQEAEAMVAEPITVSPR